jgi:hypothetical protein
MRSFPIGSVNIVARMTTRAGCDGEYEMTKFLIQNLLEVPLSLDIEPWAEGAIIPPNEVINFECSGEDPLIQFAVTGNASACIAVVSDRVTIHLKDGPVEYGGSRRQ